MNGMAWSDYFAGAPWLSLGAAVHVGLFVAVALHALRHRRRADSTLLWLFVTWTVPVAGALLYAMFGVDRVPKERWRRSVQRHVQMEGARQAVTDLAVEKVESPQLDELQTLELQAAGAEFDRRIEKLRQEAQSKLTDPGDSSGNSPDSSASTPAP